jgi:putative exosortase-associated protein (TIGR04073 family)
MIPRETGMMSHRVMRSLGIEAGVPVLLAVLLAGVPATAAQTVEPSREESPAIHELMATKLLRGVANMLTGWAEFPKQLRDVWTREGWAAGLTRGPIDGLGMLFARTMAGAYETLTFPLPVPPRYQPLVEPAYVWQPDPAPEKEERMR